MTEKNLNIALDQIRKIVGLRGFLDNPSDMTPYVAEWRGRHVGQALMIILPDSTEQVAAVVRVCAEHEISIIPQGGNTGLVIGGIPLGVENAQFLGLEVPVGDALLETILQEGFEGRAASLDAIGPVFAVAEDQLAGLGGIVEAPRHRDLRGGHVQQA